MRKGSVLVVVLIAGIGCLFIPVAENGGKGKDMSEPAARPQPQDLSVFASDPPAEPLDLLFIHHSCGGRLLAATGDTHGEQCIYSSHPTGGGLREGLERAGYRVHQASYGSRVGQATDIFDWPAKFHDDMDAVLSCSTQDTFYEDGRKNRIVVFKSCFPNNAFVGMGQPPGNPAGPTLTVWNARAAYAALLPEFSRHPEVLFVCVTAPAQAPSVRPRPLWKHVLSRLRGRYVPRAKSGELARTFNTWMASRDGWLADYGDTNVAVFDFYDILTGHGESDLSVFATGDGYDSHPSREGNEQAAAAFVPFLNRAIRRAGIIL